MPVLRTVQFSHERRCTPSAVTSPSYPTAAWCCQASVGPFVPSGAVASLAAKYKEPVYTHNSETASEVAGCIERYGMTPTELFDSLGIENEYFCSNRIQTI